MPLYIGNFTLPKKGCAEIAPFVGGPNSPPPREVKATLLLAQQLVLQSDDKRIGKVSDEVMHTLASRADTRGTKQSICSKHNREIVEDVLNLLSYNLVTNEFQHRARLKDVPNEAEGLVQHNHASLVRFLRSHDEDAFLRIFPVSMDPPKVNSINKILQRRRDIIRKYNSGGVKTNHQKTTETKIWIHDLFLLQFVHPCVNQLLSVGVGNMTGYNDEFDNFISTAYVRYGSTDLSYSKITVWMGADRPV